MKSFLVQSSQLMGAQSIPSSKSQSMRALICAALAEGESMIYKPLPSPDSVAMITALKQMGVKIKPHQGGLQVHGVGGKFEVPDNIIDCGNSGQVLRFIPPLLALIDGLTVLTGDDSIRSNRPVNDLIQALKSLGAQAFTTRGGDYAPLVCGGLLKSGHAKLKGDDSQPVSALLLAASQLDGETTIEVESPGETPWIDLTLSWLKRFNVSVVNKDYRQYTVKGPVGFASFDYTVPGDLSSMAFPLVAALITQSEIEIENIDLNEPQGDKQIIDVLKAMGAEFDYQPEAKILTVKKADKLQGQEIDCNQLIDAVPILAVVGCFAEGQTILKGAEVARHKESNRLEAIAVELRKMGAEIEVLDDGLAISSKPLVGAEVESHHDHRIAMALAVAGMAADGDTLVKNTECVAKSFPQFVDHFRALEANIKEHYA